MVIAVPVTQSWDNPEPALGLQQLEHSSLPGSAIKSELRLGIRRRYAPSGGLSSAKLHSGRLGLEHGTGRAWQVQPAANLWPPIQIIT